jgi:hypothetical protein
VPSQLEVTATCAHAPTGILEVEVTLYAVPVTGLYRRPINRLSPFVPLLKLGIQARKGLVGEAPFAIVPVPKSKRRVALLSADMFTQAANVNELRVELIFAGNEI